MAVENRQGKTRVGTKCGTHFGPQALFWGSAKHFAFHAVTGRKVHPSTRERDGPPRTSAPTGVKFLSTILPPTAGRAVAPG